jgi:hypothetical protein
MNKNTLITISIIAGVIILAIIIMSIPKKQVDKETSICIGENSILYIQLGCHACENQEKIFDKNYEYLNVIDCFYEREKCINASIKVTPTWIINKNTYEGVMNIEELKTLTGCQNE